MVDLPERLRLVLMGTGPFAVPAFDALHQAGHPVLRVITRPLVLARGGRAPPPSPVRQWAENRSLPISAPESINEASVIEELTELNADLFVVCDYGQILKRATLAASRFGGINLHGSLLPAYRGAAPVQWAVWHGEPETGVSVIHMTPKLDGGPIIAMRRTPIGPKETAGELEVRLSQIGVDAVVEAVEKLTQWDGVSDLGVLQDESKKSIAPRLAKTDGCIDWNRSAQAIDCQVRATQPWPGAYCHWQPSDHREPIRLAIREVTPMDLNTERDPLHLEPGTVIDDGPLLTVVTGKGLLRIDRLQAAGKREMTATEYRRGNAILRGTQLT